MLPIIDINSRLGRYPGQVLLEAVRQATEKPPEWSMDRMFDRPILIAGDVVGGLGFGVVEESQWIGIINHAVFSSDNELEFRKEIMVQMADRDLDPIVRNIISMRAIQYYRTMNKSLRYTIDLQKAEPRGGSYYRRVPKANGKGYTYYYSEDQYHRSKQSHLDGDRAAGSYIENKIKNILATNGGKGGAKVFKGLVTKYGLSQSSSVLEGLVKRGLVKVNKGEFHWVGEGKDARKRNGKN